MTKSTCMVLFVCCSSLCLASETLAEAKPGSKKMEREPDVVLGAGSHWKSFYMFFPPRLSAEAAKKAGIDLNDMKARSRAIYKKVRARFTMGTYTRGFETPAPPTNWREPGFDDSGWMNGPCRDYTAGDMRAVGYLRYDRKYNPNCILGLANSDPYLSEIGLVARRTSFSVKDKSKIKKMTLFVNYRGGFAAYLNGKEIARQDLPKGKLEPTTPGAPYPLNAHFRVDAKGKLGQVRFFGKQTKEDGEARARWHRTFGPFEIPLSALKDGVNVLAVESHRSDYPAEAKKLGLGFGTVGFFDVRLSAEAPAGSIIGSNKRGDGFYASGVAPWQKLTARSIPDAASAPRPVRINAAKNGSFSAQVLVSATGAIKNLKAKLGPLKSASASIPSRAVQFRYARAGGVWGLKFDLKQGFRAGRYDMLLDQAPAQIDAFPARKAGGWAGGIRKSLGMPITPKAGASALVWLTVTVPKDAAAGLYKAQLTLSAEGQKPFVLPVELNVSDWALPDLKNYGGKLFIYQSPTSLSEKYKVKFWSEEHWALIEKSLKLIGEAGNQGLIFPLIAKTSLGNVESMVRWIKKGDGYTHDYSIFDRYLDTALKYHQAERLLSLALCVWGYEATRLKWNDNKIPGVQVTVLDPATGKTSDMRLPDYGTPECEALWKPVLTALVKRIEAKGLKDKIMLGLGGDVSPAPSHVIMFRNIVGDIPWFRESHFDWKGYGYDPNDRHKKVPVALNSIVWGGAVPDPAKKRLYGWKCKPERLILTFNRAGTLSVVLIGFPPPWSFRMWMESTLTGGRNGNGRVGADYFTGLFDARRAWKGKKGGSERGNGMNGSIFNRYLDSNVGQISLGNSTTDLLAPGPEGPVTSIRFENAKEGNQEAEARIVIEKALLNKEKPLPADLAKRCQALLDARTNGLRMWALNSGKVPFGCQGWSEKNRQLFDLAGEVVRANGK